IESAHRATSLANELHDRELASFFTTLIAHAWQEQREFERAVIAYNSALQAYRELAISNEVSFQSYVAAALNNLGTVYRELNQLERAQISFEEALALFRELDTGENPTSCRPDVAMTLSNV